MAISIYKTAASENLGRIRHQEKMGKRFTGLASAYSSPSVPKSDEQSENQPFCRELFRNFITRFISVEQWQQYITT
jgi:hypothetical protein